LKEFGDIWGPPNNIQLEEHVILLVSELTRLEIREETKAKVMEGRCLNEN